MNTAIFYGSTYGNTQDAAEQLAALLAPALGAAPPVLDMYGTAPRELLAYDLIFVGCSTWNNGEVQDDWDKHVGELESLDFGGKSIALFGCGDQVGFADTFADSLGILGEIFLSRGANLVGQWPVTGYEHTFSRAALPGGQFVGLPLDYDNQSELTAARLAAWSAQVLQEVASSRVAAWRASFEESQQGLHVLRKGLYLR